MKMQESEDRPMMMRDTGSRAGVIKFMLCIYMIFFRDRK